MHVALRAGKKRHVSSPNGAQTAACCAGGTLSCWQISRALAREKRCSVGAAFDWQGFFLLREGVQQCGVMIHRRRRRLLLEMPR
ncbi:MULTISPECIES: hypothetical protein [unclassified Janthinobacterium]|uniref:hypothetical protein n=1 Tax=unclassified Janthinobacterium TaxID=2610881 RepID=UPI0024754E82|nr:hypothetical protein [Janthinobacterium sp. CG_23.4]MDH6157803.1 hypothetical protein [Janthinobacterium sp. CG_23.4]